MARHEQDREDLLTEARALVERIELTTDAGEVVAGFRRDGCGSVFFAADLVYQFNTRGELRRAFVEGRLIKAVEGRLASLERQRTTDEVQLMRHDLDDTQTTVLLDEMQRQLQGLRSALERGAYRIVGVVPAEADVASRVQTWLASLPTPPRVASVPNAQ